MVVILSYILGCISYVYKAIFVRLLSYILYFLKSLNTSLSISVYVESIFVCIKQRQINKY